MPDISSNWPSRWPSVSHWPCVATPTVAASGRGAAAAAQRRQLGTRHPADGTAAASRVRRPTEVRLQNVQSWWYTVPGSEPERPELMAHSYRVRTGASRAGVARPHGQNQDVHSWRDTVARSERPELETHGRMVRTGASRSGAHGHTVRTRTSRVGCRTVGINHTSIVKINRLSRMLMLTVGR